MGDEIIWVWSENAVATQRACWQAGDSASQIVAKLNAETGQRFTRNSVLGKLFRLRRRGGDLTEPETKKPISQRRHSWKGVCNERRGKPWAPGGHSAPQPRPFVVREISGFTSEKCHYTDDCPNAPHKGRFFCLDHCRLVYRPPSSKPKTTPVRRGAYAY